MWAICGSVVPAAASAGAPKPTMAAALNNANFTTMVFSLAALAPRKVGATVRLDGGRRRRFLPRAHRWAAQRRREPRRQARRLLRPCRRQLVGELLSVSGDLVDDFYGF